MAPVTGELLDEVLSARHGFGVELLDEAFLSIRLPEVVERQSDRHECGQQHRRLLAALEALGLHDVVGLRRREVRRNLLRPAAPKGRHTEERKPRNGDDDNDRDDDR